MDKPFAEKFDLSTLFKTKAQAEEFTKSLDKILEKIYQTNFNFEQALTEELGTGAKDEFIRFLHQNKVSFQNPSDLKGFLEKLQEKINDLPIVQLTVAFKPKEHTMQVLSDWFTLNMGEQVLFEIEEDSDLIAGAVVNFKGKHFEGSIKSKVHAILDQMLSQPSSSQVSPATPVGSVPAQAAPIHQSVENISLGR